MSKCAKAALVSGQVTLTKLCSLLGFLDIFKFFSGCHEGFLIGEGECKDRGAGTTYVPDG